MDGLRRTQEAETQTSFAFRMFRGGCRQHRESFLGQLADVLANGGELRLDAAQLFVKGLTVQEFLNVVKFFFIELGFKGPAPRHHHDFFGGLYGRIDQEPARNIHHNVAHADDGYPLAGGKITRGKWRQQVIAVNKILGGINSGDLFAGKPSFFVPCAPMAKTIAEGPNCCRSAMQTAA